MVAFGLTTITNKIGSSLDISNPVLNQKMSHVTISYEYIDTWSKIDEDLKTPLQKGKT